MATYSTSDAIYGTGIFGTARFGRVTPVISVTGVFGTGQIEPPEIGGFEVDIGVRLTATTLGTGSVGSIPASQVHVGAGLTGVTATVSIGQISISSIQTLSSVVGTGFAGVSTDEIEAAALLLEEDSIEFAATLAADIGVGISVIPTGVAATGQVQDITTVHVGAGLVTVTGTGVMGEVTPTAVVFDFAAVKEQYSKRRSVFVQRAA